MERRLPPSPLLEFDDAVPAFIEPTVQVRRRDVPHACVVTFFGDSVSRLIESGRATIVTENAWEDGPHPLLEVEHQGQRLAVLHSGVGAPLAAGLLEEVIAMGCRAFVVCGGAGALLPEVVLGHVVVVESASFRGVPLAHVLYGGDDLSGETWDHRSWQTQAEVRDNLLDLAATAALRIVP